MSTITLPRANAFIGITTPHFKECADFYVTHFGFKVNMESEDLIVVQSPNDKRCMGFGFQPDGRTDTSVFVGGMHIPFLVEDVAAVLEVFQEVGVPITRGIAVGSWGMKHFVVTDPAGIEVYISEQWRDQPPEPLAE